MKRVGILRGGTENYDLSLFQGAKLLKYLQENFSEKYNAVDIFIDRAGVWHVQGLPTRAGDLQHRVDVIWSVAHPRDASIIKSFSIPALGIAESMQQGGEVWRNELKNFGLKIPRSIILPLYQADFDGERNKYAIKKAKEVHEKFGAPWIVKSVASADMGIHVANTFPELVDAIEDGVSHGEGIIVEELIPGKRESAHTVSGYRGEEVYSFPSLLGEVAKNLHQHLGAKHYLKCEFTISPAKKIYLTELSFYPDLHPDSDFARACAKVGARPEHVIEHMIEL